MSAKKPDAVEAGGACKRLASELLQDPTKANNASRLAAALKASTPEVGVLETSSPSSLPISQNELHGIR